MRVIALFLALALSAIAQFRAGIQGSVIDPTGAAVPGITVTLVNKETNQERTITTDENGFYRFDQLPPGNYTVTAEGSGFKRQLFENVNIRAEQVQGLNIPLELGNVTESVTVTADEIPLLATESATIDGTITNEEVIRLPQIGRDPYELTRLAPGIFGLGARSAGGGSVNLPGQNGPGGSNSSIFQTENQVPISANGQRITANNFEIDGVSVNSQAWGGAAVVTPNQESVKEIRVIANSYSAESGRNTGAQIQVVSQNGTNDFHGSFVFKLNDPDLNAYNRWNGPFGASPQRVENDQKQYAGSVGGPIVRDRLFFFFSYETLRSSNQNPGQRWLETPQFIQAIASQRSNSIASQIVGFNNMSPQVTNTLTRGCASVNLTSAQCQEVPGGLDIGSIGGSLGQTGTVLGGGLDGVPDLSWVEIISPSRTKGQQFNGRVDYNATDTDRISFSMFLTPNDSSFLESGRPAQEFTSNRRNLSGAALWTRTLSPTTINEARFNVTRWYFNEIESNPDLPWGIPRVNINDNPFPFGLNWGVGGAGVFYQTTYNFRDVVSKVINTHALRFGVDINREQNNDTVAWAARPNYSFNNLWDFANDAPSNESGNFDPRNGFPTDLKKYIRTGIYALFLQDDWKVRPNLTLNLGLRWEYFTPVREKYDNISNLIPGAGGNALQDARIRVGGDVWEPDYNNFAPQFGFAWSPNAVFGRELNNRFVVRGGFGVGYNRIPMSVSLNTRLNPPFFGSFNLANEDIVYSLGTGGINSFYGWPSNPNTILEFDPDTNLPLTGAPVDIFAIQTGIRQPYSYRYSLDLQWEFASNWLAQIGYQGSQGHKFPRVVNYGLLYDRNPRIQQARFLLNDVNSNFNALLTRLERRFAQGFMLSAQYRFGKSIDTCSNDDNCPQTYPFDQRQERGPSDFDVTHAFVGSALWDVPVLRNRDDWLGHVFGGWQINTIVTANSGFPWTPVYRGPGCAILANRGEICPVRPIGYLGGAGNDYDDDTFKGDNGNFPGGGLQYFVPPPEGTTTVLPPGIGRNRFRGPRYFNTDASLIKRFGLPRMQVLGENAGVDLRFNFFNVFNQLNLDWFRFDSSSTQINSGTFGMAERGLAGRIIEFQLRFNF